MTAKTDIAGGLPENGTGVVSSGSYIVNPSNPSITGERKYLPYLGDLVDRLSIVLLKEVFNPAHREEYRKERADILHDIDLILRSCPPPSAVILWDSMAIMLANRYIWENETKIRDGTSTEPDAIVLQRLRATHAINGVRNTGKNLLNAFAGGRLDYKIDALAADLPREFGSWDIFCDT
jgi:hypothetical protein